MPKPTTPRKSVIAQINLIVGLADRDRFWKLVEELDAKAVAEYSIDSPRRSRSRYALRLLAGALAMPEGRRKALFMEGDRRMRERGK